MKKQPPVKSNIHIIGLVFIACVPLLMLLLTILPMSSNKVVNLPFLDKNFYGKVVMFSGYPSCKSICPNSMAELQQVYTQYQAITGKNDLQIVFANIELDSPHEISQTYAKGFNEEFKAYSIQSSQAQEMYRSLALKTYSPQDSNKYHNGSFYVFISTNGKWKIKRIFNNDTNKEVLLKYLLDQTA